MTLEIQEEFINNLKYEMEEGFDYCFRDYSDWKEIKDEQFHTLRQQYLDAAEKLEEYVEGM